MTEEQGGKKPEPGDSSQAETLKMATGEIIKRRSRWQSSLAALRYIDSISRDNEIQLRDTDRATSLALLVVAVVAAISLLIPQLSEHRLALVLASDVLVGIGIIMYVANRFGILTTLTPRQALLCWQLMLGASLLGIFTCMNLGLIISCVVGQHQIHIPQ